MENKILKVHVKYTIKCPQSMKEIEKYFSK